MAATPKIELRLPVELREAIDADVAARGEVKTRTAWIVNACWKVLAAEAAPGTGIASEPRSAGPAKGSPGPAAAPVPAPRPSRKRPAIAKAAHREPKPCPGCGAVGRMHQRGCPKG